nr:reverse transcriptase domain-containing protein [Tanacetum cinerariifolium]
MIKFPVAGGIVTLRSSGIIPLECSMVSKPEVPRSIINQVTEEKIQVAIHLEYPEQTIAKGSTLTEEGGKELCGLLRRHLDVFAWKPADMTGVPRHIAEHRLNVRKGCLLIRQKKRGQAPKRNKAISEEVKKHLLRIQGGCGWTESVPGQKGAFKEMKQLIAELPMLTAQREKEELIMYLAASKEAISAVLMTEGELKQRFELGEHDIQYQPRTLVKGKILADFIVEHPEDDTPDTSMKDREELPDPWILFTDGSSCIDEYEALIAGLRIAGQMVVQNLQANVDSKLMANQANYVLREIHKGSCSMHAGPRSVVAKSLRSCYYWPTMHTDARNLIRECNDCQVHHPVPRNPQEKLTPITSPWSFYKWRINIARSFSKGLGKVKFLIVAMDYFTKWIEARPVATITGAQVKKFVWDNIVCRFDLPGEIVSDNGKQFGDNSFKDSCEKLTEAVIPAKIGMPTLRTAEVDMVKNNEALGISLDLLEEKREQAAIQEARNKAKMERYTSGFEAPASV